MIAYKFLRSGAVGRFSGVAWPLPADGRAGAWVAVEGPLELCANGVHACERGALAYWLDEELWAVELDGELRREGTALVARRGRLAARMQAWPAAAAAFASACAERAGELAAAAPDDRRLADYADDAAAYARRPGAAYAALAAYAAAAAANLVEPDGFAAERRRQGELLAALLRLGRTAADPL